MVFIIGATLSLFLALILLSKKNKTTADVLLLLWMVFSALDLCFAYISFSGLVFDFMNLAGFLMGIQLLYAPLFYFYSSAIFRVMPSKKWKIAIHLLPILLLYLYNAPFYFQEESYKIAFIQDIMDQKNVFYNMLNLVQMVLGVSYTIASYFLMKKFGAKEELSVSEKADLSWIRKLIIGFSAIWLIVILADVFASHLPSQMTFIIYSAVSLFIFMMGFFGIRHGGVFTEVVVEGVKKSIEGNRYQKSGLKEEEKIKLRKLLLVEMNKNKVYLDSNLSLSSLAEKVGTSPNYLSQLINEDKQKTFHEYINSYRIEAFKLLANDKIKKNYSIQSLLEECGFGSKASFNKYFKMEMNMTPSEYLKSKNI